VQYMLLIYNCDRPEPGDPGFEDALASVNAFADECRRRGAFVAGHPLQGEDTATTVSVRDGKTMITDGPTSKPTSTSAAPTSSTAPTWTEPWSWPRCARWPPSARSRSARSPAYRAWSTVAGAPAAAGE
jgi:hypothetical protein